MNTLDIISPQLAHITAEPFYRPVRSEQVLFEALPSSTGCRRC